MRQASKRPKDTGLRVPQGAARFLNLRLEEFVAPSVTGGGERRFQAFLLRILLVCALGAALCFPLLLVVGSSAPVSAFPLILAAVALASAAWLSIAGGADVVLWLWGAIVSIALTTVSLQAAGISELVLCALVLIPLEAAVAGRMRLARVSSSAFLFHTRGLLFLQCLCLLPPPPRVPRPALGFPPPPLLLQSLAQARPRPASSP